MTRVRPCLTAGGRDTAYAYDADGNIDSRKVDGRVLPASEGGGFEGGRTTRFGFDEVGWLSFAVLCLSLAGVGLGVWLRTGRYWHPLRELRVRRRNR